MNALLGAWLVSGLSFRPKPLFAVTAGVMLIGISAAMRTAHVGFYGIVGLYGLHVVSKAFDRPR